MLLKYIRNALAVSTIANYIVVSYVFSIFIPFKKIQRSFAIIFTSFSCSLFLKIMGFTCSVQGDMYKDSCMVVSNHLSYVDILYLYALKPSLFVTSTETGNEFFTGFISSLGGSFFVERRSIRKLRKEIDRIADALKDGFSVSVFPEATSGNGEHVLPFKPALLKSAVIAQTPVQPVVIKYSIINSEPLGETNRDLVCYYGDMQFFSHLKKFLMLDTLHAEITILPIEQDHLSPKALSNLLHNKISHYYKEAV